MPKGIPKSGKRKLRTSFEVQRASETGNAFDAMPNLFELFKRRCEGDLPYLARDVLGYRYDPVIKQGFCDPLDLVHQRMEHTLRAPNRFKAIFVPRGTYKTTYVTICNSIKRLLKDPNDTILIANQVWNNSRKMLHAIKLHLEFNEKLTQAYGRFRSNVWSRDWIDIAQRTDYITNAKQPSINTAGLETAITSQHPKLIILDDIGGPENVTTSEQKQKVIDYIDRAIPLAGKYGELVLIGTFWASDDWYKYVIDKWLPRKDWDGRDLFAVLTMAIEDEQGNLAHPSVHDHETIAMFKETMDSFSFACQYMLNPVAAGNTLIDRNDVLLYQNLDRKDFDVYMTIDPAISLDRKKCWTGIVCGIPSYPNTLFIDEASRWKLLPSDLVTKVLEIVDRYKDPSGKTRVRIIGVEDAGFQKIYNGSVAQELRNRCIYNVPVVPLEPVGSKDGRILAMEPHFRHHQIFVREGLKDALYQYYHYPHIGLNNRDVIDATAFLPQILPPNLFYNPYGIIKAGQKMDPDERARREEVEEDMMVGAERGAERW